MENILVIDEKFYIVYKVTNIVTGKFYIGMHTTNNLNDNYFGSGKYMKRSLVKYGVDNHTKEIIEICDSRDEMVELEKTLVNEDFVNDPMTMNLCLGGKGGGWTSDQQKENNKRSQVKQAWLRENNPDWSKQKAEKLKESMLTAYKDGSRKVTAKPHKVGEFKHSEETKQRISERTSLSQKGKGNSQYGTCWITNPCLKQNKKIKKDDLPRWLTSGWVKGRKKY